MTSRRLLVALAVVATLDVACGGGGGTTTTGAGGTTGATGSTGSTGTHGDDRDDGDHGYDGYDGTHDAPPRHRAAQGGLGPADGHLVARRPALGRRTPRLGRAAGRLRLREGPDLQVRERAVAQPVRHPEHHLQRHGADALRRPRGAEPRGVLGHGGLGGEGRQEPGPEAPGEMGRRIDPRLGDRSERGQGLVPHADDERRAVHHPGQGGHRHRTHPERGRLLHRLRRLEDGREGPRGGGAVPLRGLGLARRAGAGRRQDGAGRAGQGRNANRDARRPREVGATPARARSSTPTGKRATSPTACPPRSRWPTSTTRRR